MIANSVDVFHDSYERLVAFNDIVETAEGMICSSSDFNALFRIRDQKTECIYISENDFDCIYAFSKVVIAGEKLFCVPFNGNSIVVIENGIVREYSVRQIVNENSQGMWCVDSFVFGDHVYLTGYSFAGLIRIHIVTEEIQYIRVSGLDETKKYFFSLGSSIIDGKVYIPIFYTGEVLCIEPDKGDFSIINNTVRLKGVSGLSNNGRELYLLGAGEDSGKLVKWNIDSGTTTDYCFKNEGFREGYSEFYPPIIYNDSIFIFSQLGNASYIIDEKGSRVFHLCSDNKTETDVGITNFSFVHRSGDRVIFQNRISKKISCFNLNTGIEEWSYESVISEKNLLKRMRRTNMSRCLEGNKIIYEAEKKLTALIDYISEG